MSGQEKGETIADIVAEMRTGNDGGRFAYLIGRPDKYEISEPSGQVIRAYVIDKVYVSELADRLEAAWKREHGNAAAMREALDDVVAVGYPHNFQREAPHIRGYCYEITEAIKKCKAALSAPPRNCDVGTAEEQYDRFCAFCALKGNCDDCDLCESKGFLCDFVWAQMPYTEGGANEQG